MKTQKFSSIFLYIFLSFLLIVLGCSTAPILKMPINLPPIVRGYKHMTLNGNIAGMVDTEIHLKKGDVYSLLATGSIDFNWPGYHDIRPELGWPFMMRVGKKQTYLRPFYSGSNSATHYTANSGNLYIGTRRGDINIYGEPDNPERYDHSTGSFSVDIIVFSREDWVQIADFLEEMKQKDPQNNAITGALNNAKHFKRLFLAKMEASKEIEETKKELQALKKEPAEKKEEPVKTAKDDKITPQAEPSRVDPEKQVRMAQLEAKLAKFTETLAQLEKMKTELSVAKEKSSLLTQELEESKKKEKDLILMPGQNQYHS